MRKILLLISILIIMISCSSTRNNGYEKFMLPENFEGSVIVLYDEKNAVTKERKEEGYIVYEIPEDGIYYTKKKRATGVINHKYYRKEGNNYKEIPYLLTPVFDGTKVDKNTIYAMDELDGGFSKMPKGFVGESKDSDFAKYIVFIVGKYKDREKLINERIKKMDSLHDTYRNNLYKE